VKRREPRASPDPEEAGQEAGEHGVALELELAGAIKRMRPEAVPGGEFASPIRGTSRGTKLREPQMTSAHLSVPELVQRDPTDGFRGSHNPKVAGSNPAPAMSLSTTSEPSSGRAFCFSKASATPSSCTVASSALEQLL